MSCCWIANDEQNTYDARIQKAGEGCAVDPKEHIQVQFS